MKRILIMMLIFTLFMAGVLVAVFLRRDDALKKRDMSFYNDQLYKITADWQVGTDVSTIEERYGCRIVLTPEEGVLTRELAELYANRELVLDLAPDGKIIGKVAWDESRELLENAEKNILKKGVILWLAVLLAGYALLLIIYIKVLRPEREMERFAAEIAKGNLDIPLPIKKDNVFGNLTTSFDIMREEMKNAREREITAEKAKKEMQLSMAHDIGTPVATIRTACEMIELLAGGTDEAKDPEIVSRILEKVRIIDNKAATISSLTDNMFHVSLAETEHIQVNVREESSELIEQYFGQLTGYGRIVMENTIPTCLVYMDRLRMEQVVDNIVGNSHKYAGTDIRVRFDETKAAGKDGEQRYVRITVRDSGPGVPEEELPLIAEKYHRGSGTEGKPGAGLGMYLASYYMEQQGGGMEYYNDHGFVVELLVRVV